MIDGVAHRQYLVLITALGIDREGHKHPLALPNLREVIRPIYDTLYCARGQAENLIKMHKGQLASDRTSCRSGATAGSDFRPQFHLMLVPLSSLSCAIG